jgi:hypothetical protein
MLLAKIDHLAEPLDHQLGLERTRFVIKAGMENAAVVARLVPAQAALFLKKE